jgi:hypothetical protein
VGSVTVLAHLFRGRKSNTFQVAIVTGEHHSTPQQTGQRPFL